MPTVPDHPEYRTKQAGKKAAAPQQEVKIFLDVGFSPTNLPERPVDRLKNNQIDNCNSKQKQSGHQSADDPAYRFETVQALLQRERSRRDCKGSQHDNGRVPERKHKADSNRSFALLHQLARYIVDCRDVICIHRVAKTKAVCEKCGPKKHRVVMKSGECPKPCTEIERQQ